ncbi:D-alanyl-lipoteichoic acid biosynthesis protein DltB [Paradesulfitobacterium ferrireducens]|uniref:D-alanyl-lipoteichoic acid biosynthesis protein DltB n=1 Tax=Paradesulfitobacterium ferrireducens TaxID=2816476 RepID=UPI001A8CBC88|nr:D-alanyl-lipoteichoic acid biosynthesis protein DltB [Paradesulfitobacterium ferrireducens]
MVPYESFQFFLYLLVPLFPAILLGLGGAPARIRSAWIFLSTLGMLLLIARPLSVLMQIAAFFVGEWFLVRVYLYYRTRKTCHNQSWVFYLAVCLTILPLALVKLSPSLVKAGFLHTGIGFLGISYLTFRVVGTIIEVRDGLIQEIKLLDFMSFVLFFPTVASGPIDRYRHFLTDLRKPLSRQEYGGFLTLGIDFIFRGFLYKFVIAYLINLKWMGPLAQASGFQADLNYMYAYGLYLFFDFAGYSAFAVGVSYILGINTPENFKYPFISKSIKDFWNRWHMSLSYWFRDYIYMRFVFWATKRKLFKNRYTISYLGYLLLFGIMGIWHGTQLQYIAYGFYHALLMIGFDYLERKNKTLKFWGTGRIWDALAWLVTMQAVFLGFLIFSGRLF